MARIARYEVGRLLGEGGSGRVYDAVLRGPAGFTRPVALKVLRSGIAGLQREARIGGLLRHRNLVDVFEVGHEDGQWFCAMERCEGSVDDHLPLPPSALVDVGLQVCAALQYAHDELGLVHLDLKPENLLLGTDGAVKVADLGIARARGFEADGGIRGTPGYMAPEQAAGAQVDRRADIYALGMTLIALANGEGPSAEDTLVLDDWLDEPSFVGPPIPPWLTTAVGPCLAADPDDRWQDMAELAQALRELGVVGPGLREVLGIRAPQPREASGGHISEEPDAFVGRREELAELAARLETPGWTTLKGSAGIGKTRLARAAARAWAARTGGRARFCDLGETLTLEGLLFAVGRALDVRVGADGTDQLGHALGEAGEVLLVLDNFEQVTHLAPCVERWRELAPRSRVLVTSRIPLGGSEERVLELTPLAETDASELLAARALQRGVDLSDDPDLPLLARRLDGMPLALELAAGRLGVLSVRDVLDRLGLSLLRGGSNDRRATLRASLAWSWDLLSPRDQRALAQLSVFHGSFALEAAEAVVDAGGSILDAVERLLDSSMLQNTSSGRYGMLASVREFASEHLAEPGPARDRHARFFEGEDSPRVDDLDNLVVATRHAVVTGEAELATSLLTRLWPILDRAGPYGLGKELAEEVAALRGVRRYAALRVAARATQLMGARAEAEATYREALDLATHANDRPAVVELLADLGGVLRTQGRFERASETLEEGLTRARQWHVHRTIGAFLDHLGVMAANRGDPAALDLFDEAMQAHRQVSDRRFEGITIGHIADFLADHGETTEARERYTEALAIHREVGNRAFEAICLGNLGTVLRELGLLDETRAAYEAALALHGEVGDVANQSTVLGNFANFESVEGGRHERARELYERALAIAQSTGNRKDAGLHLGNLGVLLHRLGQHEEARVRLREAIEAGEGFPRLQGFWMAQLATEFCREPARAMPLLERAEALLVQAGDPSLLCATRCVRVRVLVLAGDLDEARAELERARAIAPAKSIMASRELTKAEALLADVAPSADPQTSQAEIT